MRLKINLFLAFAWLSAACGLSACATDQQVGGRPTHVSDTHQFAHQITVAQGTSNTNEKTIETCKPGVDVRSSDLCAQWKAADAAASSAWWAWLAGIVGTGGLLIAFGALWLARRANEIAGASAERQLRAYVLPGKISVEPPKDNEPIKIVMHIKNTGQTPASAVRWGAISGIYKNPVPDSMWKTITDFEASSYLAAGEEIHSTMISAPLTASLRSSLKSSNETLYIYGEVNYIDAFGRSRETRYRLRFKPEVGGFSPTSSGNDYT